MIRVRVVDDEPAVCRELTAVLERAPDIQVVGTEFDGAAAVDATIRLLPDVVLMDLSTPGVGGLSAIQRIRELRLPTRVLLLTVFETDQAVREALRSGASGFLLKATAPQDLVNLVRVAAQGQVVLSPWAADRLLAAGAPDEHRVDARQRIGALSPRELQVLALLGDGATNAEIGRALFLTEATVRGVHIPHLHQGQLREPDAGKHSGPGSRPGATVLTAPGRPRGPAADEPGGTQRRLAAPAAGVPMSLVRSTRSGKAADGLLRMAADFPRRN